MPLRKTPAVLACALLVAPGCAHERTTYAPADPRTGQPASDGPTASAYSIPRDQPRGRIYVMSLGGERLPTGHGQPEMFLHLRLAAENQNDDAAWVIDARDQMVSYQDGARMPPHYAQAGIGGQAQEGPPILNLQPGQRAELDLWYPLPPDADPPQMTLGWQVQRGAQRVAETTVFQRTSGRDEAYTYYAPAYHSTVSIGVGAGWWWGPYWGMWDPWWGWGYRGWGYGGWGWGHPRYYYGRPYARGFGRPASHPGRTSVGSGWRGGAVRAAPAPGAVRGGVSGGTGRAVQGTPSRR